MISPTICGTPLISFPLTQHELYILQSIKQDERNRRGGIEGISTMITCPDQQLPIDMDMFWALADNKIQLQQFFIKWLTGHYSGNQPLYFGGAHPDC